MPGQVLVDGVTGEVKSSYRHDFPGTWAKPDKTKLHSARLCLGRQHWFQISWPKGKFEEVSPQDAVKAIRFRVLLICGLSDRKIPCRHSEAIYNEAIGANELGRVPSAGH